MSGKAASPPVPVQPHVMQAGPYPTVPGAYTVAPGSYPGSYPGAPATITVVTVPAMQPITPSPVREKYPGVFSVVIGIIRIVLVFVAIIVDAATIRGRASYFESAWIGIFFITSGALGIAAGRKKTRGLIIAHMVMSILGAALFAVVQFFITFFITLVVLIFGISHTAGWVLMIITIIQFLLNICGAILGCVGTCGSEGEEYPSGVPVQTVIPLAQMQPQPTGYAVPPPAYAETANAALQNTSNNNLEQNTGTSNLVQNQTSEENAYEQASPAHDSDDTTYSYIDANQISRNESRPPAPLPSTPATVTVTDQYLTPTPSYKPSAPSAPPAQEQASGADYLEMGSDSTRQSGNSDYLAPENEYESLAQGENPYQQLNKTE